MLERPVYLAGFGQNRRAQSVHDDLCVRALALVFGETRVDVAALDLIGLGRRYCQEIERRVNEAEPGTRTLLSCTHTHHGPDTIGLWGPDTITSGVPAIVGLTNDELGYILPQEAYVYPDDPFEPGEHYEETMSIGPGAGPRLNAALVALLARK